VSCVLAWCGQEASDGYLYRAAGALRLCGRGRGLPGIVALLCGLAAGGCSFSMHSLLSSDETDVDRTGSTAGMSDQGHRPADGAQPSESDLAYARAAALDLLLHSGKAAKDTSVPWQNPNTGAGGNITPLATSHDEGGLPCRDFLASYVHGSAQDWLQGTACRTAQGNWEVKSFKPLKQG
jgi:surface antigen